MAVKIIRKTSIVIICLSFIIICSCSNSGKEKQNNSGQNPGRPATLVKLEDVKLHDLNKIIELPGTLEPENIANVLSTNEGKITQMNVRQGDKVSEGQILAMLSPLLREDIINTTRLNLVAIEQELEKNPGDETLKQQAQEARLDYEFALNQYREIPVIAPVNGIISDRWVDIGDMVPAREKMFEIQSNSRFLVKVLVSELDIRKISAGQSVSIVSDACPEQAFIGQVQRIYPQIDRQSRNATVEISLPRPCSQLRSGMFVRVLFTTHSVKDAVAVPITALIKRNQKQSVFIIEDHKAREVLVETGLETNGIVEIISGLNEGQQVVVEGQGQLQEGAQVRIQKIKTADN